MNVIAVPYGTEHQQAVRKGDTLRVLVQSPKDGNAWGGNVTFKTSISVTATADVVLAEYTGGKVQGKNWDLYVDYDTSALTANTHYLAVAEVTSGTKKRELVTVFDVLPEGRT